MRTRADRAIFRTAATVIVALACDTSVTNPGLLTDATTVDDWTSSNLTRYTAEAAVARFRRVMPDTLFPKSPLVGQAYLYAGFANRLLGDNFCQSVIPVEIPDSLRYRLAPG